MRRAIVGHRGWIAQALIQRLLNDDDGDDSCDVIMKSDVPTKDMSCFDVVYLFAGRSRPMKQDMIDEAAVCAMMADKRSSTLPSRLVYMSSQSAGIPASKLDYLFSYAKCKSYCESILYGSGDRGHGCAAPLAIIRAPVIFGPGQPTDSDMLLPTLCRSGHDAELKNPYKLTGFLHVDDMVSWLANLGDQHLPAVGLHTEFPGVFYMTSKNAKDLMETFMNAWGL